MALAKNVIIFLGYKCLNDPIYRKVGTFSKTAIKTTGVVFYDMDENNYLITLVIYIYIYLKLMPAIHLKTYELENEDYFNHTKCFLTAVIHYFICQFLKEIFKNRQIK